jgi:hypothetical protein
MLFLVPVLFVSGKALASAAATTLAGKVTSDVYDYLRDK